MLDLVLQSIASGVAVGCIYGLIGIGFCVIYNASGIVNFAQGAFVMLGGMVASAALTIYGLPLPLAGVLAILVCAALGIILERIVVRPLWNRQSAMFVMILATLAAQIVIERLTLIVGRRSAAHLADVHRPAAAARRRPRRQLSVPVDRRRLGSGHCAARAVLLVDQDRQGDAGLLHRPRRGGAVWAFRYRACWRSPSG